ncbi:hypothetical protein AHYW_002626 [Providencia manganoxydans]|uniref:S49 family peptidase n=1 Tax=Providencia manganoxydans TaxID=2923283 RepID=UPI003DA0F5D7
MAKKPCQRVLSALTRQPWAIRPDMLDTLMAIAQREGNDPSLAAMESERYQAGGLSDLAPPGIAVIDITGPIFARADLFSDISGAATCERITHALDDTLADPSIGSIILRIDSPGGEVTGIHELANHIYASRDIKPLVAYVSGSACSAAYWLAAATSYIFTDKTASLGSIGVVAAWTDSSEAREKQGIKEFEVVSSQSPNKRLSPDSDEGRAALQAELDGLADIFISDVATFRRTTVDNVIAQFGQGGTLLAESAITVGMADELSSLREVVALLNQDNSISHNGGSDMTAFSRKKHQATKKGRRAEETFPDKEEDPILDGSEDDEEETLPKDIPDPDASDDEDPDASDDDDSEEPIEEERDPDAEEEDEEKESHATHKAANRFAKTHPNLYSAILRRGARRERGRIQALDDLAGPGRDSMLQAAKFGRPRTVASTMRQIFRAEKQRRTEMQGSLREDANFYAPPAPNASSHVNTTAAAEKSVLEQIKMGANTHLGRKA